MFKQLFATMHEVLDEVVKQYPTAGQAKREMLKEQVQTLKTMSDDCIELWLSFEERFRALLTALEPSESYSTPLEQGDVELGGEDESGRRSEEFQRAQGYYLLRMYDRAVKEFEFVLKRHPESLLARAYLAMGYTRLGDFAEASRHFSLLIPLTDNATMKAISYNIMGCIHFEKQNVDKATEYFSKAYHSDPKLMSLEE